MVSIPVDKYCETAKETAKKRFDSLLGTTPDYWKCANAFDTMVDFIEYCSDDQKAQQANADNAAQWLMNKKGYEEKKTWFDDYGWWTIATGRAAEKTFFTDSKLQQLREIASDCWCKFKKHAPHVWERRAKDKFSDCSPAVPEGVWNGYWQGTDQDKCPGPVEGDPTTGTLLGIQNTVTNAVYLLSAQVRKDDNAADAEFGFLNTWFNKTDRPMPERLWWSDTGWALVRERMPYYQSKPAPGFDPQWAWTGDQGLIIGALVGQCMRKDDPELIRRAEELLNGVQRFLVNQSVLNNWTTTGKLPTINLYDPEANYDDYSTGSGVFWRYALRVWEAGFLKLTLGKQEFKDILGKSANAAVKGTPPDRPSQLTNDLAVLVAACRMPITPPP